MRRHADRAVDGRSPAAACHIHLDIMSSVMDVPAQLVRARRRAGLSQRRLAALAGTSQATVSAYETGRKLPSVPVLERLLRASGAELRVADAPGMATAAELAERGRRLAEVIALAEALPYRPARRLRYPRLPTPAGP